MVTRRSILGIDISPTQIRVVEMQGKFSAAHIVRAETAPTPPGAVQGERIIAPEMIAPALRALVDRMGVTTKDAIFGVPPSCVATRILDLPPVQENQLRGMLEGELDHFQIIREGGGSFDYMRLNTPSRDNEGGSQVLLMAAEDAVIQTYRLLSDMAGLTMLALEPTLLALFRVGAPPAADSTGFVSLNLSYGGAEVVVMSGGQIRLYRRIDVGTDTLIAGRGSRANAPAPPPSNRNTPRLSLVDDPDLELDAPEPARFGTTGGAADMNPATTRILATELQRSLDYYRRENPQAADIQEIYLTTNDPDLGDFAAWLTNESGLQVTQTRLSRLRNVSPDALARSQGGATTNAENADAAWLGAVSLGAGCLPDQPTGLPHFNLSSQHIADAAVVAARRKMQTSVGVSAALFAVGALAFMLIRGQAGAAENELARTQQELDQKQRQQQVQFQQLQTQQTQLTMLRGQGFPFSRLMDAVAAQVPAQTDLSEVTLDSTGKLLLTGETLNEKAITQLLDGLRTVRWLDFPVMEMQDKHMTEQDRAPYTKFKISAALPTVAAVAPAPAR